MPSTTRDVGSNFRNELLSTKNVLSVFNGMVGIDGPTYEEAAKLFHADAFMKGNYMKCPRIGKRILSLTF